MLTRTQILLDKELIEDLSFLSEAKNEPIAQLVRKVLAEKIYTSKRRYRRKKIDGVRIMLQMAASTRKHKLRGPRDLSKNHDHYLYGFPSKSS